MEAKHIDANPTPERWPKKRQAYPNTQGSFPPSGKEFWATDLPRGGSHFLHLAGQVCYRRITTLAQREANKKSKGASVSWSCNGASGNRGLPTTPEHQTRARGARGFPVTQQAAIFMLAQAV